MLYEYKATTNYQRKRLQNLAKILGNDDRELDRCNYLLHNGLGVYSIAVQKFSDAEGIHVINDENIRKYLARSIITTDPKEILREPNSPL
jgi:hypothetical protein